MKGFDATRDLPLIWAELQQQRRAREMEGAGGRRRSTAPYAAPPALADSSSSGGGDAERGEAELDHILFIRVDAAEVTLAVDENEINDARFFSRAELSDLVADGDALVSPWFRKIYATLLPAWWDEVEAGRSPAGAAAAAGQDAAVVRL